MTPRPAEILIMKEEFGPIQVYLTGHIDLESRLVEARRWGYKRHPYARSVHERA